jgi:hypothetical protein
MNLKAFALIAGSTATLMLGAPASARFLGLSTETVPNEFGLLTVRVFADFDSPGLDFLSAVYGTDSDPLIIEVVAGTFYQHPLFGDWAPNPAAFQKYPLLRYDTFVTVGVESFNPNDPGHPEGRPADHLTFVNFPGSSRPSSSSSTEPGRSFRFTNRAIHSTPPTASPVTGEYSSGSSPPRTAWDSEATWCSNSGATAWSSSTL